MHNSKAPCASIVFLPILLVCLAFPFASACYSQTLTDTLPHNKNAVIEEFTAVRCYYCPSGHALLDSIIDGNPGRIIPVAMYPSNVTGTLTLPYAGSPDLRRTFVNAFFTIPFVHDSIRFFPGAFVNRRQWNPLRREQSRETWRQHTDTILNEKSPLNIGMASVYQQSSSTLAVDVEVYLTDTVNSACTLYVMLTEDSLVAEQLNGGVDYIHNHVFREALTLQWGDTLFLQANKGAFYTKHYVFDNSAAQYNIYNSHIAAYVRNASNEEIITGTLIANDNIVVSTAEDATVEPNIQLFPNPSCGMITLSFDKTVEKPIVVEIYNVSGILCYSGQIVDEMKHQLDLSTLNKGMYFVLIKTRDNIFTRKLIMD